jgi:hypothetical protein
MKGFIAGWTTACCRQTHRLRVREVQRLRIGSGRRDIALSTLCPALYHWNPANDWNSKFDTVFINRPGNNGLRMVHPNE